MRSLVACIAIAASVHSACAANEAAVSPPDARAECAAPEGWDSVAARNPRHVVFGELHGTEQAPQFVGALACALARHGERVLVAIEQNASDDPALQAAWALPAGQFAAALAATAWPDRQDGVGSAAMFAMLVRAHALKSQGLSISVVAFNGMRDAEQARRLAHLPGQGPHEAAQAENIARAAESGHFDRVLILVGSLHARTDSVELESVRFDPMARHLAQHAATLSFDMRYGLGTSWNCLLRQGAAMKPGQPIPAEAIECANHPHPGNADLGPVPFISLNASSGSARAPSHDGIFWVGPVTGSPPYRSETR